MPMHNVCARMYVVHAYIEAIFDRGQPSWGQSARFAGDATDLATTIVPCLPFANAIRYNETSTLQKHMLTREPLRSLLRALHGLQQNMSFNNRLVEQAMAIIGADKFHFKDDEPKDFSARTAAGIRT